MSHEFVTVTGRRVTIKPMTGEEERILLESSKNPKANRNANKEIISRLVSPVLDWNNLLLGEETDLLYLIRLVSLTEKYEIRMTHGGCGYGDYPIDIREFSRFALECASPECPCHKYCPVPNEELLKGTDLATDLSDIPEGHYETNPPELKVTLPVSGDVVSFRHALCSDKEKLGKWVSDKDSGMISKSLALLTTSISSLKETDLEAKYKYYLKATQLDRIAVRDAMQDASCGVDTEIIFYCKKCLEGVEARIEMDAPFWMPPARRKRSR